MAPAGPTPRAPRRPTASPPGDRPVPTRPCGDGCRLLALIRCAPRPRVDKRAGRFDDGAPPPEAVMLAASDLRAVHGRRRCARSRGRRDDGPLTAPDCGLRASRHRGAQVDVMHAGAARIRRIVYPWAFAGRATSSRRSRPTRACTRTWASWLAAAYKGVFRRVPLRVHGTAGRRHRARSRRVGRRRRADRADRVRFRERHDRAHGAADPSPAPVSGIGTVARRNAARCDARSGSGRSPWARAPAVASGADLVYRRAP